MYTKDELQLIKDYIEDGSMTYRDIALDLKWKLRDGSPNVTRVWRAVQRIKRDSTGGRVVKAISPRDVQTVGDAIKAVREIINAIPHRLYLEPLDSTRTET